MWYRLKKGFILRRPKGDGMEYMIEAPHVQRCNSRQAWNRKFSLEGGCADLPCHRVPGLLASVRQYARSLYAE